MNITLRIETNFLKMDISFYKLYIKYDINRSLNWRQSQPLQVKWLKPKNINDQKKNVSGLKKIIMSQIIFDVSRTTSLKKQIIWELSWPSLIFLILRPFMEMSDVHFTREKLRKPKILWKRYKLLVDLLKKNLTFNLTYFFYFFNIFFLISNFISNAFF